MADGTKVTESVSTVTIEEERRESRIFRKVLDLWPLWLAVAGGIVTCIRFWYRVNDLSDSQARWQQGSEQRRDKDRDIKEADHIKAAVMANDLEWLKKGRQ